jgi:hypothetical protein
VRSHFECGRTLGSPHLIPSAVGAAQKTEGKISGESAIMVEKSAFPGLPEHFIIDYLSILAILRGRRWYTMPEFAKQCQSFYKPSNGLSSMA